MKIKLVRFEDGLADFEIGDLTARCNVSDWDLNEFMNGELIIRPYAWFDMNDDEVSEPEWFGRKELFELNNVFERGLKRQNLKAQRTTISRSLVFIELMKNYINTTASGGAKLRKLI